MPTVLHVLPADAALNCPGLEDWLSAGAGFDPVLVADDARPLGGRPVLSVPQPATPWFKPLARFLPGEASPWVGFLRRHEVSLIHLHDVARLAELSQAADRLDLPVVLTWPRGAGPDVPFAKIGRAHV